MLKNYYRLTKPGIIYGNLITAAAGFFLASKTHIYFWLLVETLGGLALVIASACVFNNYFDRGIDAKMARTQKRALVSGLVSTKKAIVYATLLGLTGLTILAIWTNALTVLVTAVGFVDYVILYGITKRRSIHGTLVGSIAGATPPLTGYLAVSDHLDGAALILFLILVFWQMPHFYSIAIYRLKDYKNAGLPVLPAEKGIKNTKIQIFLYIAAFSIAALCLSIFNYTGYTYFVIILLLSLAWLLQAANGFKKQNELKWARRMFFFSLLITLCTSLMIAIGPALP